MFIKVLVCELLRTSTDLIPTTSGSASTGSTKSSAGNMELYAHTASSSYNETMSGETLSSVSEKSCISGNVNGAASAAVAPMSAVAMHAGAHIPYLVSTKEDRY